jgi:hypothetical protein
MDLSTIVFLLIIVFAGFLIQSISGFGAVIFSLPFALLLLDYHEYVPVTLILTILQSLYIAYKDREYIDWKAFRKMIVLAFIGMPIGLYVFKNLPEDYLKALLAMYIIINSSISLYRISNKKLATKEMGKWGNLLPIMSGCLQASFAVGGPMISAYISKVFSEKRKFRVMICLYWCVLNPVILLGMQFSGLLNSGHVKLFAILFPAMAMGILGGNILIDKISQLKFEIFVHSGLIVSALLLF